MNFLLVFIGGGIGCVLRYLIGTIINQQNIQLPIATLISNTFASIVFAIVLKYSFQNLNNDSLKYLLLIGFCGGLSTFSTFSYETYLLLKTNFIWAIINLLLNTTICIGLFFLIHKQSATT